MWCSNGSTTERYGTKNSSESNTCSNSKSNFTGFNLLAMILGFVFFWPVGLLIVFWICSGRRVQDLPSAIRDLWDRGFSVTSQQSQGVSDNSVFNAYQQTQFDRISEIKEEIKSRAKRFNEFRSDAQRRADEDEFNRFMNDTPNNGGSSS